MGSGEILGKLGAGDFGAAGLSACDFSLLCAALPHGLVKDKLIYLIERVFQRGCSPCLASDDRDAFFTSEKPK